MNTTAEQDSAARLDDLESRIAHQDATIDKLNEVVCAQWATIDRLTQLMERLEQRVQQLDEREDRAAGRTAAALLSDRFLM
ncbi:MAG: SlyX family protein [Gammaproteobacteria bacterium]|nr:SlyX family protein [Gammaproteobacteria bacterium]